MKAMILAAGLGSRLKPWTDSHPKALVQVNKQSLLQRNIDWLQSYGIKDIVVNVHHFSEQIIETLELNKNWGARITISDESDKVLETGGGLAKAAPYLRDELLFLLMNVDVLTDFKLPKMITQHIGSGAIATLATSARPSSRNLLFNEKNMLCGWRNDATGEEKISVHADTYVKRAFNGVHLVSGKIFEYLPTGKKYSIIDAYLRLCSMLPIQSYDQGDNPFIDVGKPESVALAEKMFK